MAMRVFITAGASGIGRALADAFLEQGARVAAADADPEAVAAFAAERPQALARVVDVRDEAAQRRAIDEAAAAFGGLDVVCANAGTAGPAGAVETLDAAAWRACVDVNLTGAFLTAKHAAPILKRQRAGLLLFTSSTAGQWGYPFRSPYACAKWAIVGLTKTLAMELGPFGVRVNALAPGAVEGARMERVLANEAAAKGVDIETARAHYVAGVSLKSWVTAQEVAGAALYLASPAAARISGQILAIDGNTETLAP